MARKTLKEILLGNFSADFIMQNFSYIIFLTFLAIFYIANAHYADKKVRGIQDLQKEVKELRWEYMSLKSKLMYDSKQSEVAEDVAQRGLSLMNGIPKKIEK